MTTFNYEDFFDKYTLENNPYDSSSDGRFETYGEEIDYVLEVNSSTPSRVWTVIETENGLVIANGYHFVNRIAYYITEEEGREDEEYVEVYEEEFED